MDKKLKILISDDSKLLRKKLREELENLGCEVIEAENGKEAVMKDLQEQPDGVILDIVMPEVGGIEALQVIKEVNPEIPVVMLSSAGTPQKLMETLKLGALDFIQKPYTSGQIKRVVEAIRKKVQKNEEPLFCTISFESEDAGNRTGTKAAGCSRSLQCAAAFACSAAGKYLA